MSNKTHKSSFTNIWNSLSTLDRRKVQHNIRANWNAKTAQHPFLGVDMVPVGSTKLRMTQEQYATLWLQSTLELRRVPTGAKRVKGNKTLN